MSQTMYGYGARGVVREDGILYMENGNCYDLRKPIDKPTRGRWYESQYDVQYVARAEEDTYDDGRSAGA